MSENQSTPPQFGTFLDLSLDSYVPPQLAPDGAFLLKIESVEVKQGPNSNYINARISFAEHEEFEHMFHILAFPSGKSTKGDNFMKGNILNFLEGFSLPANTSLPSMVGATGWWNVETKTDLKYGSRNVLKSRAS